MISVDVQERMSFTANDCEWFLFRECDFTANRQINKDSVFPVGMLNDSSVRISGTEHVFVNISNDVHFQASGRFLRVAVSDKRYFQVTLEVKK